MKRYFLLKPALNELLEVETREEWREKSKECENTILRTDIERAGVVVETTFIGAWDDRSWQGVMFQHRVTGIDARWRFFHSRTYAEAVDKHVRIVNKALRMNQARFGNGDTIPRPRWEK